MREWVDRVSDKIKVKYEWFEPERTVLEQLNSFEDILELGSGKGRYTKLIPRIVGLEYSQYFINYCHDNVKGLFLRGDAFRIPIKDNSFDCVFSSGLIEHFDDPDAIIREHRRVCREGGIVIITVPAKDSPDCRRAVVGQECLRKGEKRDWHYYGRRMGDKELEELLLTNGLVDVELFHLGVPWRGKLTTIIRYLTKFFSGDFLKKSKGIMLELAGFIISSRLFKLLTCDYINKKYTYTHGYYLFSKSIKKPGLNGKDRDVEQKVRIRNYEDLYKILACPKCLKGLSYEENFLICASCNSKYPIKDRIPYLLESDAIVDCEQCRGAN